MQRLLPKYIGLILLSVMLPGCSTHLPASHYSRVASHALDDTADTRLGRAYRSAIKRHPGESGFHLLPHGPAALMTRIALIEASERSIDMQYFSTEDDTTGKLLLQAVLRAADRGVRVRMLLDAWVMPDAGALALNTNPHIEIRIFNPYSTRDQSIFGRMCNVFSYVDNSYTRRMHNKAMIIDNQVAVMGGRNLGDEYFEASKDIDFRDIDIFAAGPIAHRISSNFDQFWNSNEAYPLSAINLPAPDPDDVEKVDGEREEHWQDMLSSPTGRRLKQMKLPHEVKKGTLSLVWADAQFTSDSPDKIKKSDDDSHSSPMLHIDQLVANAKHEFIIFTPYFVPLDDGVKWLTDLVARGVNVRIVTNSLSSTDMVPAQAGYSHYREALVKGGVELYEVKSELPPRPKKKMFKPSSQNGLHAKIYMIDRQYLVLGSFNLDPRSVKLNTEQVLVIHSPQLCEQIAKLFEEVTSPDSSYRVIPASAVPASEQSVIPTGSLVWRTEEDDRVVYYDFNPHASFWRRVTDRFFSVLPIDSEL